MKNSSASNWNKYSIQSPFLAMLPADCISEIISWTSPLDAAKLCVTSKAFKAAADSDTVWKTFLPSDYQDIISRQLILRSDTTFWGCLP
ncbi:hypothetical protein Leryth_020560 [Lithospermum erythrorhizon]|nr:hypothetical protein Leryth_020560 [Lithospermum erythrorhizon]